MFLANAMRLSGNNLKTIMLLVGLAMLLTGVAGAAGGLRVQNGWLVHDGEVIWGCAQHNGWWGGYRKNTGWIHNYKVRTAICRNAPGEAGPSLTEDLSRLTDAMLKYGYPGFEHNYGLWYDRRRDNHDTGRRTDADVEPPFMEQPWARSDERAAWDGSGKYDLRKFNRWYFDRLKEFARQCDSKGTVLFHNFYMQHALLENPAHYVDFPWRPVNCVQNTQMPDTIPAANSFYDIADSTRRELHRLYIRKCLDELGDYSNVIHLVSQEYTGGVLFVRFWMDTIKEWELENHKTVKIGLVATKDVMDAILEDAERGSRISTLCLSYWWYNGDGTLYAPKGGMQIPARYTGDISKRTTPESLYRQISEYRLRYPDKAVIQHHEVGVEKAWAFLMGGGSMIIAGMQYPDSAPPKKPWDPPDSYIAPAETAIILPTYDFIRTYLSRALAGMRRADIVVLNRESNWCLADNGENYLVFALNGGRVDLDLSKVEKTSFAVKLFNPRNGNLSSPERDSITGGSRVSFEVPDKECQVLWLVKSD